MNTEIEMPGNLPVDRSPEIRFGDPMHTLMTISEAAEKIGLSKAQTQELLAYLIHTKVLVRLDAQFALHMTHFNRAKKELCLHFREHKTLAAGEFREKLGSTRKFVLPLLETFDRLKWTRRMGSDRVLWRLDLNECEEGEIDG